MGLSLALNTARTSLLASSSQIAVASRNIAGANDPTYSRKIAMLVSGGGSITVTTVRAADAALYGRQLASTSGAAERDAVLQGIKTLSQTVGDTNEATAPTARLSALNAALEAAANEPDNLILARAAVDRGNELALSLRTAADAVHAVRKEADTGIATSVTRINDLLVQYDGANRLVMKGTATNADISDALDNRERILSQLAEEVGITTVEREGGDLAIYTDSGVPLFERSARTVSFTPTTAFAAGSVGGVLKIDGVAVTGPASPMPLISGRIAGLVELRDTFAPTYEAQIDALAGALVDAFAETDKVPPIGAARAGLFVAGAGIPAPGAAARMGLASLIRINPGVDPALGGDPTLLRDGGMNGTDYRSNTTPAEAAYSGRLRELTSAFGAERVFDSGSVLSGPATLSSYANASAGWLEALRKETAGEADYQNTMLGRATEARANVVGVNGDDELALTMQLERSYGAAAKILSVVDELMQTLLNAVR